ncbi:hypothetical protein AAG570_012415 [Ranatra chinensis]|uniref:Uncharacterized protein n=1 Tax=Ranatra chinensis TaxID=642074 RepID=A0ABD0YKV4_9HEMI
MLMPSGVGKDLIEIRAELQGVKERRANVLEEVSCLNSKLGITSYPILLRDYKYIDLKYNLVRDQLDSVKRRYNDKCEQLKRLEGKLKKKSHFRGRATKESLDL